MNQINFSSILNESQQQFTDLFQENKIVSGVKKAASSVSSGVKKAATSTKTAAKSVSKEVSSKATQIAASKAKETVKTKAKEIITPKKKEKSNLDKLETVSKKESNSDKIKDTSSKVVSQTKNISKDPIKAATAIGAVTGGAAGAATGFGVGLMVKDLSDGVKEVKGKLMENNKFLFEEILNESDKQFTDLFESTFIRNHKLIEVKTFEVLLSNNKMSLYVGLDNIGEYYKIHNKKIYFKDLNRFGDNWHDLVKIKKNGDLYNFISELIYDFPKLKLN